MNCNDCGKPLTEFGITVRRAPLREDYYDLSFEDGRPVLTFVSFQDFGLDEIVECGNCGHGLSLAQLAALKDAWPTEGAE